METIRIVENGDTATGCVGTIRTVVRITPEPETPGAHGATLLGVQLGPTGLYEVRLGNMSRNILETMRPGDPVEVRALKQSRAHNTGAPMSAQQFKAGDRLIANDGNRRVDVEDRDGELWAIPVLKNDDFDPMPLQEWLNVLYAGARRIE